MYTPTATQKISNYPPTDMHRNYGDFYLYLVFADNTKPTSMYKTCYKNIYIHFNFVNMGIRYKNMCV